MFHWVSVDESNGKTSFHYSSERKVVVVLLASSHWLVDNGLCLPFKSFAVRSFSPIRIDSIQFQTSLSPPSPNDSSFLWKIPILNNGKYFLSKATLCTIFFNSILMESSINTAWDVVQRFRVPDLQVCLRIYSSRSKSLSSRGVSRLY